MMANRYNLACLVFLAGKYRAMSATAGRFMEARGYRVLWPI